MSYRVVAFGNRLQTSAFGFLGAKVIISDPDKEAEQLFALLQDNGIAVLLVSYDVAQRNVDTLSKQPIGGPVVLAIPDGFGEEDPTGVALRKLVIEAVGIDLLGKESENGQNS